ncbi:MAG: lasso peptide biosynthesis B2 protein [Chloroflexota bacterium]
MLNSFWHLPWASKILLLQTAIVLGSVYLLVYLVSFRRLSPWLGNLNQLGESAFSPIQLQQAQRVRWAVVRVSQSLPWHSTCLVKAIAAKFLLSQRKINATLYLGAALDPAKGLEAHAWLRCGKLFIIGEKSHRNYHALASFS